MVFSTLWNTFHGHRLGNNDVSNSCHLPFAATHETNFQKYTLVGTLNGHSGPVNAVAFNASNTLLASGGDDEEVRIWDIGRLRLCQKLMDQAGRWGQVTCVQFIVPDSPSNTDWLCFGTGRGLLALYRKSRRAAEFVEAWSFRIFAAGDSVEAFAFDPNHQRLAVSSHYGKIKMLRLQQGKFVELWEDELLDAIPRALSFSENGRVISIFAMETGTIFCRDVDTSATQSVKGLKTAIGYVSQCIITGNILIDNMRNGFDLYLHNRTVPSRTFQVQATMMYVIAGVFGEKGKIAICGSDHGRIYVYGVGDLKARQELSHGRSVDVIQALETSTTPDSHIIASGISGGKCDICIWKRPIHGAARLEKGQMAEKLMMCNMLFCLLLIFVTRETWTSYVKSAYISEVTLWIVPRVWKDKEFGREAVSTPSLEEILHKMDDKRLRQVLRMPARLSEEILKIEKPQQESSRSPNMVAKS